MSSILEALEKSERERNQENVPRYHSMKPPVEKSSLWKYLLLGVIVFIILVGAYFLFKASGLQEKLILNKQQVIESGGEKEQSSRSLNKKDVSAKTSENRLNKTKTTASEPSTKNSSVLAFAELTEQEKTLLPDQRINVVSVSENKARSFIMLGDKMYREGNTLGKGALLKEIHNDHIIIKYNDHLIRKDLD